METLNELTANSLKEESFEDLSEKDRAFAIEYITNGYNHLDAAVSVGYVRSQGLTHLRKPLVQAFIRHLQESSANAKLISQQFVESKYLEVLPKLMGEEEVEMVDLKTGESFHAKKFHSAETVSVLRDLGKAAGYVPEDQGKGGSLVNVTIDMGKFTGQSEVGVTIEHEDE